MNLYGHGWDSHHDYDDHHDYYEHHDENDHFLDFMPTGQSEFILPVNLKEGEA